MKRLRAKITQKSETENDFKENEILVLVRQRKVNANTVANRLNQIQFIVVHICFVDRFQL